MVAWEDKAFNTSKWYSTIILAIFSFFLGKKEYISFDLKIMLVALIVIFGISTLLYLFVCKESYFSNYSMSVYTENVLNLFKKDEYISGHPFFPTSFRHIPKVKQLSLLIWFHLIMILVSSAGILLL